MIYHKSSTPLIQGFDFEANLMRRMNGLLYISGIESAEAKERASNQFK